MDDEAAPEPAPLGLTVGIDQRLEAMGVEVVEDDVDSLRFQVSVADPLHRGGETTGLAIRRRVGEVAACLGRDDAEDVGGAAPDVFVVALGDAAWGHRSAVALGRMQLHGSFIEGHHGLLLRRWLLHQVQHVLHPLDVLAVQLRDAPHFFPATASARGSSATAGLFPCRPMRRCLVAPPPSPAARPTTATARAVAGYTRAPRPPLRFVRRISSAAWAVGPRSGLPRGPVVYSGVRPGGPPAGRSRPRPPCSASSTPCRAVRGSGVAATVGSTGAFGRPSSPPAHAVPPPLDSAPGTAQPTSFSAASHTAIDHSLIRGASLILTRGAKD